MVIVQIYTYYELEDALAIAEAGADHLGITVLGEKFSGLRALLSIPEWKEVFERTTLDVVKEIFRAVKGRIKRVLMPLTDDLDELYQMVREVDPDIIHVISDFGGEGLVEIKRRLPDKELMLSIFITPGGWEENRAEYERALARAPLVDYLLLDTKIGARTGVTGRTHNWDVSRAIVERSPKPVILAGGLNPDNVVRALEYVRPAGVDACTQLDLYPGKKDLEKVRRFIEVVRSWERRRST